jgi:uncharacterized membrane protein YdjX (TVP38/TMEM64 family)
MKARRSIAIVVVLIVAAAALAARILPLASWLHELQDRVGHMGALGMALYAVVYWLGALLFVPGLVLTIGAGLAFGFVKAMLVVMVASNAAAATAFLIARHLARDTVEKAARKNPRFGAIDRAITNRGALVVLLLRLSPLIPFSLSNYLYGLTAVRFVPYLLASTVGMLPGTALYVYLGSAGRAVGEKKTPGEWALLAGGLVATAAVTIVIGRAAKRELASATSSAAPSAESRRSGSS